MPMLCSRTRTWAALTFFHRWVPLITSPTPSRNTCCYYSCGSATTKPLPQPEKARAISALTPAGSCCNIANMSTENSSSAAMSQRMVWVDLEMTGLDIEKDQIIEMACIITDAELNIIAQGPHLIIKQPDELLDGMSDWCTEHHGQSGLTEAVRSSTISLQQAEYEFLSFVRQHTPPGQCPLAGNSVHADKRFLDKFMPQFMYHLHYRIIDVSTIKELCRRWFPDDYKKGPHKRASHRALDDIQESIEELRFFRTNIFKPCPAERKRKITDNGESETAS